MVAAGCGGGGGSGTAFDHPSGTRVIAGEKLEITPLALRRHGREVTIDMRLHNIGDSVDPASPGPRGHLVLGGRRPAVLATGQCPDHTGFPPGLRLAPGDSMLGCLHFVVPDGAKATAFRFGDTVERNAPEWPLAQIPTGGPAHIRDEPAALPHGMNVPATLLGQDYAAAPAGDQAPDNEQRIEVTMLRKVDYAPWNGTPPEDGMRLVAVQVRIRNAGSKPYYPYVESDVLLWDTGSHAYGTTSMSGTTLGSWPDYPVAPGATITGYLSFEVPASAHVNRFEWVLFQGGGDAAGYWVLF
ncbi:MAG: DUF4352 domain-containing protein [Mycobacteriales bacterium]